MKEVNIRFCKLIAYILVLICLLVENTTIKENLKLIILLIVGITLIVDNYYEVEEKSIFERTKQELKKIFKEILMFIPFTIISVTITRLFFVGASQNQAYVSKILEQNMSYTLFILIVIGPIIEEILFRYLPSGFIENKVAYIIISSLIFSGIHVLNDENMLNHLITGYLLDSVYYAWRYSKTKDLLVTVSLHSFHNLFVTIIGFLF